MYSLRKAAISEFTLFFFHRSGSWVTCVSFPGRQHVGHPPPCPPEAVARGAGGQRPIPGAAVDRPGRDAIQDPVETRHATHAAAGGRGHDFQGKHFSTDSPAIAPREAGYCQWTVDRHTDLRLHSTVWRSFFFFFFLLKNVHHFYYVLFVNKCGCKKEKNSTFSFYLSTFCWFFFFFLSILLFIYFCSFQT